LTPDENGVDQIVGFDIEVANAIAEEAGFDVSFENRSFGGFFRC
jgi:ABC-type amino acid transport substrate-binding protein